jgi:hypothetical protein
MTHYQERYHTVLTDKSADLRALCHCLRSVSWELMSIVEGSRPSVASAFVGAAQSSTCRFTDISVARLRELARCFRDSTGSLTWCPRD